MPSTAIQTESEEEIFQERPAEHLNQPIKLTTAAIARALALATDSFVGELTTLS